MGEQRVVYRTRQAKWTPKTQHHQFHQEPALRIPIREKAMTRAECVKRAAIRPNPALKFCAALAVIIPMFGCTSLTITAPADGATVTMPQDITVTEKIGTDGPTLGPRKTSVDGVDTEHFGNVNFSVPSPG